MVQKLGPLLDNYLRGTWMHSTSGVCYEFSGGPTFPKKRSADVLTSYHSSALSTPAVSSSLAILHVLIRPWTTVESSGLVWPFCQETGTVHLVDRVILGIRRLSLVWHRSVLVWQPPIIEHTTDKHGASATGQATRWWWIDDDDDNDEARNW